METHPWIDFKLDLRKVPSKFWMLLADACAKCQFIAGIPLQPETAERLHRIYLIKGVRATTAIEGNTLSEEEVAMAERRTLKLPPSKEYLGIEVRNIIDACNQILDDLRNGHKLPFDIERIKDMNELVLRDLELDDDIEAGKIRTHPVVVGNYRGAPAADCEYLLNRLCTWLNNMSFESGHFKLAPSILKAIIAHLYIAWIHPFGDGNGRTARLVEHQILMSSGTPSPAAQLLSNHYNETRSQYYRVLNRSSRISDGVIEFIVYALQGLVDGLTEQINTVREQIENDVWTNHVFSKFQGLTGSANERRRYLVLALSQREGPVSQRMIRYPGMSYVAGSELWPPFSHMDIRTLTPQLAQAYNGKTSKTITRDINALIDMGLVKRVRGGIITNKETIQAFLPFTIQSDK